MKKLLFVLIVLAIPTMAAAQSPVIVLPSSQLQITASPDHNATSSLTGAPLVTKYIANYCQVSTPTSCVQVDLGKGTPNAQNVIVIPNFFGQLTPNILWTVSVFAQGPGGDSTATAGNAPFGLDAPAKPRPAPAVVVVR